MQTAAEIHLEGKAKDIAKSEGISYAAAYSKALEQNPSLYKMYVTEVDKRDPRNAMEELRKAAERTAPKKPTLTEEEEELEGLARKRATETGVPFERAYAAVLQTEEGKRLYSKIVGNGE